MRAKIHEASTALAWLFFLSLWTLHWLPPVAFWVAVAIGCTAAFLAHWADAP